MTDLDDGRYVGQQIRSYRRVRSYTQQQLADFVGISRTAVTMYETGERPMDSRELLYSFAQALQVSVGDLTGHADDKVNPAVAAFHAAVPLIEAALMSAGDVDDPRKSAPLTVLIADADRAQKLRTANDYAALGALLPGLLTGLYQHALADAGENQERAWTALTTATFVTALATKTLGHASVGWTAAREATAAASRAGNVAGVAAAEYASAQVLLATPGALTASLARSAGSADRLQADLRTSAELELYGMLHLHAALTSAALRREPGAHLDEATETASRCGDGIAFDLSFGPANVAIWRMSVALERREGGRAIEVASAIVPESIPTVDRQSRFFIELGRAHALEGDYRAAMSALLRAEHLAPQKIRSHTIVRELVGHMLRKARRDLVNGDLGKLAKRVGAVPM